MDVRDESAIAAAVKQAAEHFGGINVLVNNASAISLKPTLQTSENRLDLMWNVNMRATFLASKACVPYLKNAVNPHVLTLSPPLDMNPKWFSPHLAYTISKYGMSMCTLGMAHEFAADGIAFNCLWPRTTIATAAIELNFPEEVLRASRKPSIVADAAAMIFLRDSTITNGNFFIDETVLRESGVSDFSEYAIDTTVPPFTDLFLD